MSHPQIKIKTVADDLPGFKKPYLGYRRDRGMPSAREPVDSLDLSGDSAYKGFKDRVYNQKKVVKCRDKCQFRTKRTANGCAVHINVSTCDKKKFKTLEFNLTPMRIAPKLKGLGSYDV